MKNADMPAMPVLNGDNEPANMGFEYYSSRQLAIGLTKREMMAMHILSGLLSDPSWTGVPADAVRIADDLLAELDRTSTTQRG